MTHCFYSPLLGEMICDAKSREAAPDKRVEAADQVIALADKLDAFCNRVSDQVDSTDRVIAAVDQAVQHTHRLGLCHRTIIVGPIAVRRMYGSDGPPECLELIQPAITPEFGCGAVCWSSDDYRDWEECGDDADELFERCKPLRDCQPAVRVASIGHIPDLLRSLLRRVEKSLIAQ